ncbi:hypothetical protein [Stenotrophomonas sp. BIGb0135]|uniref:hypothetical protein n=1 Tax=Stenotrophomonas sp. BIGb0135 TaxID=2940620 RepID=UPI002167D62E|nr:hypothetical protein [Stenotrophomonas sp. BIGb0135]MCS4235060.1 ribosomal protein L18E [Stenotrophomonas sp. BIGb0135]MCS4235115.1 ribosomal protein L18E [Stenotrophomonas sp. BIGb0135]
MTDLMPTGQQALRNLADTYEQQARLYDHRLWRDRGQRSTVAETFRHAASIARQQASKLERLAKQLGEGGSGS